MHHMHDRKWKWFWMAPLAILAMILFVWLGGQIVMYLWNWLVPSLIGWHQITFWQALGLLVLCRILFGRLFSHGGGPRSHFRNRMRDRWDNMAPEEREKLRDAFRARCAGFTPPPGESSPPST